MYCSVDEVLGMIKDDMKNVIIGDEYFGTGKRLVHEAYLGADGKRTFEKFLLVGHLGAEVHILVEAHRLLLHYETYAETLFEKHERYIGRHHEGFRGTVDSHPLQAGASADFQQISCADCSGVIIVRHLEILGKLGVVLGNGTRSRTPESHDNHQERQ